MTNSLPNDTTELLDTADILPRLFQPAEDVPDEWSGPGQDVALSPAPGITLACRFYDCAPDAPTLLYFPGGSESCAHFNGEAEHYSRQGVNVFLASYRGTGRSTGTPTITGLFSDGRNLLPQVAGWLRDRGYTGALFVMGRSLGAVAAIDAVCRHSEGVKGLFIESGFCETAPVLLALGVPPAAIPPETAGFANLAKIATIKIPTIIFHGARDQLVPVAQAEKLQAAAGARNKQFFIIPGADHHAVGQVGGALYYQKIKEIINGICGVNTWRQRRREFKGGRSGERT